jgi:hypothetical protein
MTFAMIEGIRVIYIHCNHDKLQSYLCLSEKRTILLLTNLQRTIKTHLNIPKKHHIFTWNRLVNSMLKWQYHSPQVMSNIGISIQCRNYMVMLLNQQSKNILTKKN